MLLLVVPLALLLVAVAVAAALDARALPARRRWVPWALAVPAALLAWAGAAQLRDWLYERAGLAIAPAAWAIVLGAALAVAAVVLAPRLAKPRPLWVVAALAPVGIAFLARGNILVLAAAFATAAALWPRAVVAGLAHGGFQAVLGGVVAVVLALASLPGAFVLLVDATDGGAGSLARHAWSVEVEPNGTGRYVVTVPFLRTTDPNRTAALDALSSSLRVASGSATARLVANGSAVQIEGSGPVRVEAIVELQGSTGQREAFTQYVVADAPVLVEGLPVRVAWSVDMSGGSGHACWMRAAFTLDAAPGRPAPPPGPLGSVCA